MEILIQNFRRHYASDGSYSQIFPWFLAEPFTVFRDSAHPDITKYNATRKRWEISNLEDLIKHDKTRFTPHRILLEGHAGIGKSSLCYQLARDWTNGLKYIKGISLVLHLPLWKVKYGKTLEKAVTEELLAFEDDNNSEPTNIDEHFVKEHLKTMGNTFLLILDGFEELELNGSLQSFYESFGFDSRSWLRSAFVLVTTRDTVNTDVCRTVTDDYFRVKPLTSEKSDTIIGMYFEDVPRSEELVFRLERSNIPLDIRFNRTCLEEICRNFSQNTCIALTEVYLRLFKGICASMIWKYNLDASKSEVISFKVPKVLESLQEVCDLRVRNNRSLSAEEYEDDNSWELQHLEDRFKENTKVVVNSGLFRKRAFGDSEKVDFIHSSCLHFLAAFHLYVQGNMHEVLLLNRKHFIPIVTFLCGLLKENAFELFDVLRIHNLKMHVNYIHEAGLTSKNTEAFLKSSRLICSWKLHSHVINEIIEHLGGKAELKIRFHDEENINLRNSVLEEIVPCECPCKTIHITLQCERIGYCDVHECFWVLLEHANVTTVSFTDLPEATSSVLHELQQFARAHDKKLKHICFKKLEICRVNLDSDFLQLLEEIRICMVCMKCNLTRLQCQVRCSKASETPLYALVYYLNKFVYAGSFETVKIVSKKVELSFQKSPERGKFIMVLDSKHSLKRNAVVIDDESTFEWLLGLEQTCPSLKGDQVYNLILDKSLKEIQLLNSEKSTVENIFGSFKRRPFAKLKAQATKGLQKLNINLK